MTDGLCRLQLNNRQMGQRKQCGTKREKARPVARQRGSRLFECDAQIVMARVLLRTEGSKAKAAIESALAQAQALVEETGARIRQPLIHIERAELARIGDEKNAWRGEL